MLAPLTGQPIRLRQANPKLPERLERVMAQAPAHQAEERYQTMAEFEEALRDSER